jgi:hypothetical protein
MQDLEMKKKVAQEIMALMDEKDGEMLKKHPKLMTASVEVEKDPVKSFGEDEASESPEMEAKEGGEEEISPEMIKKLLEMMNGQ